MRIKDLALTTNVGPGDMLVIDQGTATPVTRRTPVSAVSPTFYAVNPRTYGAVGNGIANDTAAVQAAIATGQPVVGYAGDTYLVGPLTQTANDQLIDFTGCTLKRVNNSAHAAMLTLGGLRAKVIGGRWDGNKVNQSGTVNQQYAHAAVTLTGDYCTVEGIESFDSWGIGIKGQACSYASIRFNRCLDSNLFGVYVETGASADEFGNEISDNYVASTGIVGASGIYLTGTNDFVYNQYCWKVCRNTVQLSQNASVTGICITTRGYDGVCNDNVTTGGTMGISGDVAQRTTFSGNRCSDTSGLSNYGIEINNQLCTVIGNVIDNTRYGISISGTQFNQLYTTITGNVIRPQSGGIGIFAFSVANGVKTITGATSANPIQFTSAAHGLTTGNFVTFSELPGNFSTLNGGSYQVTVTGPNTFTAAVNGSTFAGYTSGGVALRGMAQYLNITGNTIKFNGPSPLTGNGGAGIYLQNDTRYVSIKDNVFVGPGQTIPNGVGVYLDGTGGYCQIIGNRFASFERPAICYSGGAVTFTDITFNNNDCSYDCPQADNLLVTSGGAVFGARITQMFNNTSNVNGFQINVFDKSSARQFSFNDGFSTPEGNVAAAMGSIWSAGGYGEGNTLYIKETGANTNTGWIPVNSAYATFAQLNDPANAINTLRKRYGRLVTDTTNNRQYFAFGTAASDPWYLTDGTAFVTPSSGFSFWRFSANSVPITTLTPSVFSGNTIISTHGADGTAARQMIAAYGGNLSLDFRRALGTAAAPTAITNTQVLGSITWSGYNGSAYTLPRASIAAVATENWTAGANGTYLSFQLSPRGTATATEVAAINDNGSLELGRVALSGVAPTSAAPSRLLVSTNAYTDNTTAASGTVTQVAVASILSNTLAASNTSVTYTNASSLFIAGAPTAGSNVTITNPWALRLDLGNAYLGDRVDGNPANVDSVGFRGTPVNSQSAAYQLVAADAGKSIVHPITDNNARTFTIPANGTVPFPVGTTITFINMINTLTIAITTDTMYLAGAGTTGSRTLAAYGMATAVKVSSTSWIISGSNLS